MKTPARIALELMPEEKRAVSEYSQHVSDTARLRRLPETVTQAQIIREEFRSRPEDIEHVVLFSDRQHNPAVTSWMGNHMDLARTERLAVPR